MRGRRKAWPAADIYRIPLDRRRAASRVPQYGDSAEYFRRTFRLGHSWQTVFGMQAQRSARKPTGEAFWRSRRAMERGVSMTSSASVHWTEGGADDVEIVDYH